MNAIVSAKDIIKTFEKGKDHKVEVLKGVSLEVEEKMITVIVGASGAGKSTLLHILSGLDKPDSGEIEINQTKIFNYSDEKIAKFRNENIGFVFQFHHLLPELTAIENVAIAKMISGIKYDDAVESSKDLLDAVGLGDRLNHKPAELSGGEQQRVAVARALANNPSIIFMDEPTGNLDSKNSEILHELFLKLKEEFGSTFLIVTHNPELIKIGDRVLEMKDGMIVK